MADLIIIDSNSYNVLHLDKYDNDFIFKGFSIENKNIKPFNKEVLSFFKLFKLSDNKKYVGVLDGYETYLDLESGLYHFFINGREDFEKFYFYNSKEAKLVLNLKDGKNREEFRKFVFYNFVCFIASVQVGLLLFNKYSFSYHDENILVNQNKLFNTISYSYQGIEKKFSGGTDVSVIKELIYSSKNLSQKEKELIFNQELLDTILPYYKGNYLEVLTHIRHENIGIEPYFFDDGTTGFYYGDNILHIKNYDSRVSSDFIQVIAHEYIHLLQSPTAFSFVKEASAEIMSYEFYLNDSNNNHYSYLTSCKYLKILMEIIGPEAILDNNFNVNSTFIQDEIRPYLSNDDYVDFLYIMNLSPSYDREELVNDKFERLHEILSNLYKNKFNASIFDDGVINAILLNKGYNRAYFRYSLHDKISSYYSVYDEMDINTAIEKGLVNFYKKEFFTNKDISSGLLNKNNISSKFIKVHEQDDILVYDLSLSQDKVVGSIVLKNGDVLNAEDALSRGYVDIYYVVKVPVSVEEYKMYGNINSFYGIDINGEYNLDLDLSKIISVNPVEVKFVPSIFSKFKTSQLKYK